LEDNSGKEDLRGVLFVVEPTDVPEFAGDTTRLGITRKGTSRQGIFLNEEEAEEEGGVE